MTHLAPFSLKLCPAHQEWADTCNQLEYQLMKRQSLMISLNSVSDLGGKNINSASPKEMCCSHTDQNCKEPFCANIYASSCCQGMFCAWPASSFRCFRAPDLALISTWNFLRTDVKMVLEEQPFPDTSVAEDLHRLLRNMYLLFIFLSPFLVYVRSKNGEKSLKLGHFNIDRSFVIQIQESLSSDQWQFISMDETGEREMTGVRTGERKIASYCGNKNKNLSGTYAWSAAWIYLLLPYWRTVIQFLHKKSSSKYLAIKLK